MKCQLCKEKKADKTGSHIVPHFILKNIDNLENSKDRNKELGFEISSFGAKSYFGRDILPEKLEEIYGNVTDDLIENNNIPLIQDYIFCTECEKKLSIIESEYSKNVVDFRDTSKVYNKKNVFISFLFWISILWRLSIGTKTFYLNEKDKLLLRSILKNYLRKDITKIVYSNSDKDLRKIKIKILKSDKKTKPAFKILNISSENKYPYILVADDYIVSFYLKSKKNIKYKDVPYFKDIIKLINKADTNSFFKGEKIYFIESKSLEKLNKDFMTYKAKDFLLNFIEILDELHKKLSSKENKMPMDLKVEILDSLAQNNEPLGNKYTIKNLSKVIYNILKKYST